MKPMKAALLCLLGHASGKTAQPEELEAHIKAVKSEPDDSQPIAPRPTPVASVAPVAPAPRLVAPAPKPVPVAPAPKTAPVAPGAPVAKKQEVKDEKE